MTATTIRVQMAQRKDTAANWTAANPILLSGEIGYETDTKKFKIGNGSTNWNSLAYLPIPDGSGNLTITGNLEIGSTGSLTFEGSTADGFETTLAVTNPTADRTITLPNQSGTVLVSGNASIVDADIAANAEIAVSKLADGTARQLLQTDAAGTGVEWTSNVDIPGTLDVTGAATFDAAVTVAGDLTVNGTTTTISTQNLLVEDKNIIIGDVASPTDVTADGGGITLKGATDKTINWVDATDAWTSSERFSVPLSTAALPSLTFTGDPNTGIYSPGADQVAISTGGSPRVTVTSTGVGIGTTSPSVELDVRGEIKAGNGTVVPIVSYSSTNTIFGSNSGHPLAFVTSNTERARIDTSGRLLVGTSSSATTGDGQYALLQIRANTAASTGGGIISLQRGESATSITTDEPIGSIVFADNTGNEFGRITAFADANAGTNDYPGRLVFSTTADGASSPTERMRITQGGTILIGKTANDQGAAGMQLIAGGRASFATDGSECIYVNRNTNDGNLIELAQAGTIEGTISVSGTTVSYNGAHLSRWSQLPSGAEREEILRGSVLSNVDEMCEWGDEENEQLNRMKVSDVEGDKNVSGVFQAWDDDDDTYTNDFYCAMTGDFIIRIGAGVTVERGDLLMSAGDGTAKPQADDLVRSCTIAKVTSTNVSCTYDDGSYCVPCVLMAC